MAMSPAPPPMPWAALAWIVRDWMLVVTTVIAAFICVTCCRKKKPVEDLMAKPTFNKPVTVTPKTKTLSRQPIEEKPVVEHTVSIKLDNNADEDDLKGPRESMSKDPMTDVPVPTPRNKGINEFKSEHDKETNTPPSHKKRDKTSKSKEDAPQKDQQEKSSTKRRKKPDESTKRLGKTMEEQSVSKKRKVKSKPKASTKQTTDEKQKKTTVAITTCEGNLDATQEFAPSAEDPEQLQSAKEGTTMSYVSTRKKTASAKQKQRKGTPTKDMDPTQEDHGMTKDTKASAE
uniref:Uncharacterized protein n=1 Tax=Panagrellus redivivus TaxID=6233 RepID=A0A7E4VMN5_PANRE